MPSRLQLLVVFWSTGAAAIFLTQALITGEPLTLATAVVLSPVACLGATLYYWLPAYRGLVAELVIRIGASSRATVKRGSTSTW